MVHEDMKVYVGLSGGVDSSVTAALLQKEGHVVHGIYLKVWSPDLEDLMHGCPWEEDVRYASAVAEHLGIPFEVWDVSKEYYDRVVSYFFAEYEAGRTPNPDIMCNREIKFGIFLERALAEGADAIATGHYARLERESPISKSQFPSYKLLQAKDLNKDQSYFLYSLIQEQLQHALFPIGEYTKPEVRAMAKEWKLPTASRKDSQGLCFLGKISVRDFLKTRIASHEGALVTTGGKVVGKHEGAQYFTIGQRHGIGSPGGGTPYFVVEKNIKTNRVVVAEGERDPALYHRELTASDPYWIAGVAPDFPLHCKARIRYRQPLQDCVVSYENDVLHVLFEKPQRAVTAGQAVVFYLNEEMLGGAIIHG